MPPISTARREEPFCHSAVNWATGVLRSACWWKRGRMIAGTSSVQPLPGNGLCLIVVNVKLSCRQPNLRRWPMS